jgi:hypothetical protein
MGIREWSRMFLGGRPTTDSRSRKTGLLGGDDSLRIHERQPVSTASSFDV